jgi:hypothetical protein
VVDVVDYLKTNLDKYKKSYTKAQKQMTLELLSTILSTAILWESRNAVKYGFHGSGCCSNLRQPIKSESLGDPPRLFCGFKAWCKALQRFQ